jgi:uncharacterized protein
MTATPLRPFSLLELRLLAGGRRWDVDQPISGLDSLTPVRGSLRILHHGGVLDLETRVDTIVTLRCDRCLNHFNHSLRAEAHELLELAPEPADALPSSAAGTNLNPADLVPSGDDLDDRLDPQGLFDPELWLFEQLSLRLPLVSRCGSDCVGPATWSSSGAGQDPRWAALARLQGS